jgi:lysophospholipase L1-like esterase
MSRPLGQVTPQGAVRSGGASAVDLASRLLRSVRRRPRIWEHEARIAFLGDGLGEGAPGASYFNLLQSYVGGREWPTHGRDGDTVADLEERMRAEGLEDVDVAFLWTGANDAAMGAWAPWGNDAFALFSWKDALDRAGAVYSRLMELVLARASRIVCVPPVAPDPLERDWEQRVADVAELVRAATASETRAALLDLAPWFADARARDWEDVRFTIDGVHLSPEGAAVVAEAFAAQLMMEAGSR